MNALKLPQKMFINLMSAFVFVYACTLITSVYKQRGCVLYLSDFCVNPHMFRPPWKIFSMKLCLGGWWIAWGYYAMLLCNTYPFIYYCFNSFKQSSYSVKCTGNPAVGMAFATHWSISGLLKPWKCAGMSQYLSIDIIRLISVKIVCMKERCIQLSRSACLLRQLCLLAVL